MKKIFTLFAAMLLAVTANAKTWNITDAKADTLKNTIGAAGNGDTIVMAKGTYTASSSIGININLVLVADDKNNKPLVKARFGIQGGKRIEFQNLKFDASLARSSHLIYANDSMPGNQLVLEGCELSGDTANSALIHCGSSELLDSCIINNCYFHEIKKSCFFNENTDVPIGLKVTNSTFANISTVKGDYYAGVIDTRATSGKVRVDHCTFYNCYTMNTDYAIIGKIGTKDAIVSNCIFSLSSAGTSDYRTIRDKVTAKNCLVYNYTTDSNYGMQGDVTKDNCIKEKDPLFTNAASGDFSFPGNYVTMALSPARGAATDGSDLGDPRWYTPEVLPIVDFEDPYVLAPAKAVLNGRISLVNDSLKWSNRSDYADGVATWKINATKSCYVSATLTEGTGSGHRYKIVVLDEKGNMVGDTIGESKNTWKSGELSLGTLLIPAGVCTIKLLNLTLNSTSRVAAPTLTHIADARTLYLQPSSDWKSYDARFAICTRDDEKWYDMTDVNGDGAFYKVTIKASINTVDFCRMDPGTTENNWENKWTDSGNMGIDAPNDLCVITGWDGKAWARFANIADGYYVIGLNTWDPNKLTASYLMSKNGAEEEWMLENVTLEVGDSFKAIKVEGKHLTSWYGAASNNNYEVTSDVAGDSKTIYFRPTAKAEWSNGHLYVPLNPTIAVNKNSINFGDAVVKDTKGSEDTNYLIETISLTGAHLTGNVRVEVLTTGGGSIFATNGYRSVNTYEPADGAINESIYAIAATGFVGNFAGTLTISSQAEPADFDPIVVDLAITVVDNPTSVDNSVVSENAVKKLENGMLIIEKNGVRYNILGTQVK